MGFLESIGGLTLIAVTMYLWLTNEDRKDRLAEEGRIFLSKGYYTKEFNKFRAEHRNLSEKAAINRFFDDEKRTEIRRKMLESDDRIMAVKKRMIKEYVKFRVFAYEHEDFIFWMFADYMEAIKANLSRINSIEISTSDIYSYIRKYPAYKGKDSDRLFFSFVDNELIRPVNNSQIKKHNQFYKIGDTLDLYANVISDDDMNFDKWMELHNK